MSVAALYPDMANEVAALSLGDMPDTCSVKRQPQTDDNSGGWGGNAADVATSWPCRFSDGAGMEQLLAGAQQGFLDGVIVMPTKFGGATLSLLARDQIVINARATEPARTFEVIGFGPGEGVLITAMVKAQQT